MKIELAVDVVEVLSNPNTVSGCQNRLALMRVGVYAFDCLRTNEEWINESELAAGGNYLAHEEGVWGENAPATGVFYRPIAKQEADEIADRQLEKNRVKSCRSRMQGRFQIVVGSGSRIAAAIITSQMF